MVKSINDEAEATDTMTFLMNVTATLNCGVMVVLHQNKTTDHLRGHLGTECLNKSESVVSINYDEKTAVRYAKAEQTRKKPFEDVYFDFDGNGNPEIFETPQLLDKTNWTTERQTEIITDSRVYFKEPFTKLELQSFISEHDANKGAGLTGRKALDTVFKRYFIDVKQIEQVPNTKGKITAQSKWKFITS